MAVVDEAVRDDLVEAVFQAAVQICGGGCHSHEELREWTQTSIHLTNKRPHKNPEGKPHDYEIRLALKLYHRTKRKQQDGGQDAIELVSDMSLVRVVSSPHHLGSLLCNVLNQAYNVRVNASGILCLITPQRQELMRKHGKLPCPQCLQWSKGEKGLWWHQQIEHSSDHGMAKETASGQVDVLAIIPYDPARNIGIAMNDDMPTPAYVTTIDTDDDIFELARHGNLRAVQKLTASTPDAATLVDRNGATALHWAAGAGKLQVVNYLIEICHCSVDSPQRAKRSFGGRTPLHWAARNGHLSVVRYLVNECSAEIDAKTLDGTTAFGWASWQCHLSIMQFLHEAGCDIHLKNSFGCNAVLWCAQGGSLELSDSQQSSQVEAMAWLKSNGCDLHVVNSNGHGALHKAAQRGKSNLMEWLIETMKERMPWIGPDTEGCCPSDLAGMEGHVELAEQLVVYEGELIVSLSGDIPEWLFQDGRFDNYAAASSLWEPWGGVRRMSKTKRASKKKKAVGGCWSMKCV